MHRQQAILCAIWKTVTRLERIGMMMSVILGTLSVTGMITIRYAQWKTAVRQAAMIMTERFVFPTQMKHRNTAAGMTVRTIIQKEKEDKT